MLNLFEYLPCRAAAFELLCNRLAVHDPHSLSHNNLTVISHRIFSIDSHQCSRSGYVFVGCPNTTRQYKCHFRRHLCCPTQASERRWKPILPIVGWSRQSCVEISILRDEVDASESVARTAEPAAVVLSSCPLDAWHRCGACPCQWDSVTTFHSIRNRPSGSTLSVPAGQYKGYNEFSRPCEPDSPHVA